jgi:hypothetical protein
MDRRRVTSVVWVMGLFAAGSVAAWRSTWPPPPAPDPLRQVGESLAAALPATLERTAPRLSNPSAYLPAQCYADTRGAEGGRTRNGCFACHQTPRAPNYVEDAELQTVLTVSRSAEENRWTNVLQPPPPVEGSETGVLAWVRTSNYVDARGGLRLASALAKPPAAWDANGDGRWEGYTPDCWFQTDGEGFDHSPDGR